MEEHIQSHLNKDFTIYFFVSVSRLCIYIIYHIRKSCNFHGIHFFFPVTYLTIFIHTLNESAWPCPGEFACKFTWRFSRMPTTAGRSDHGRSVLRLTDHHWMPGSNQAKWLQKKSVAKELFWAVWALRKVASCFVVYGMGPPSYKFVYTPHWP